MINSIYTLYSRYLLGISPFKGLVGGVKQLGRGPPIPRVFPPFSLWCNNSSTHLVFRPSLELLGETSTQSTIFLGLPSLSCLGGVFLGWILPRDLLKVNQFFWGGIQQWCKCCCFLGWGNYPKNSAWSLGPFVSYNDTSLPKKKMSEDGGMIIKKIPFNQMYPDSSIGEQWNKWAPSI